jgi:DUF1365 family protein
MASLPCIYDVSVGHSRTAPVGHRFSLRSYMWCFDLDRPPRPAWPLSWIAGFRRSDHLDVRAALAAEGLEAARIVTLTNLRVLGYVFNPISVHWCYDTDDRLVAHVAEVHNTYGGRHAYVLPVDGRSPEAAVTDKAMYVSPFYPVDGRYRLEMSEPAETVSVRVTLERPGDEPFRASLTGRRVAATPTRVLVSFIRHPLAPLRGRALIQWQGIRLWRRGLEVQPR